MALGPTAIDDLLWVEAFPLPDAKVPVLRRARSCGGVSAVALIAAARLGLRTAYVGILDSSDNSRFVLDALRTESVDTSCVRYQQGAAPALSVVLLDENQKTRTILYDLSGIHNDEDGPLPESALRAARVLLIDNFHARLTIRAAEMARASGAAILADFENPSAPRIAELISLVDHLVVSADFALAITGLPAGDATLALAAPGRAVVVTCGAAGAWYSASGSGDVMHHPAFGIEPVDTNGCGDVFHGAYAAALVRGSDIGECVRFSSAAAAVFAVSPRGVDRIPNLEAVKRFLRDHDN